MIESILERNVNIVRLTVDQVMKDKRITKKQKELIETLWIDLDEDYNNYYYLNNLPVEFDDIHKLSKTDACSLIKSLLEKLNENKPVSTDDKITEGQQFYLGKIYEYDDKLQQTIDSIKTKSEASSFLAKHKNLIHDIKVDISQRHFHVQCSRNNYGNSALNDTIMDVMGSGYPMY